MTYTREEFEKIFLGALPPTEAEAQEQSDDYERPNDSFNWADKGMVSGVKNQGSCGSCWAFSATGTVESFYAISKSQKVLVSEQQLVDCSRSFGNYGCSGGWPSNALNYVKKNGLTTESKYPYTGRDGTCKV